MTNSEMTPTGAALAPAVEAVKVVMMNEEVRFSNLNTRAISLLSATSLITALAGLFSKEILGGNLGDATGFVAAMLLVTLAGLLATAGFLVLGVLMPSRRVLFGANEILDDPQALSTVEAVQRIVFLEFAGVMVNLRDRNRSKVRALHKAYASFLVTVLSIAVGAAGVPVRSFFASRIGS